ncbi:hypothetical protein [Marinobacter subterrani]|uniref:hypothetical protein n=1 Tax=Marinobacter subterrani TaxID=1658765 RepID=UPI0023572A45|nr:hypothetical protein [Marinobacter subterrani]
MNLFIASSPLQLFNCVEARNRFHQNEDNHLLFIFKKAIDLEQAQPLLDENWASKAFFKWTACSRLLYGFTLQPYLRRFKATKNLYLGYPYNIRAHFANTLDARVWIVDDGNYSVWLVGQLDKHEGDIWRHPSVGDRLLRRQVSTDYLHHAGFFTTYPLTDSAEREVIFNDFRGVRAEFKELSQTEDVIFIGSPVIGTVVRTESQFRVLMAQVSAYFNNRKIRYVAHRYEDLDRLRDMLEGLPFEVVRFSTLIELQFLLDGRKPRAVASVMSSALVNLGLIYDIPMTAFRVPKSWIPEPRKDAVCMVYEQLARDGVSMVPVTGPDLEE